MKSGNGGPEANHNQKNCLESRNSRRKNGKGMWNKYLVKGCQRKCYTVCQEARTSTAGMAEHVEQDLRELGTRRWRLKDRGEWDRLVGEV